MNTPHRHAPVHCELRFQSLFNQGRSLAFPCDEQGRVDLKALSAKARQNFVEANAAVGREYSVPALRCVDPRWDHH